MIPNPVLWVWWWATGALDRWRTRTRAALVRRLVAHLVR